MKLITCYNKPSYLSLDNEADCLYICFEAQPDKVIRVAEVGIIHLSPERLALKLTIHHELYIDDHGVRYFLLDENAPDELTFFFPERSLKLKRVKSDG